MKGREFQNITGLIGLSSDSKNNDFSLGYETRYILLF